MGRNRFLNLSKFRYPHAASIMVWATSFPASILASLGTPPNSFFSPAPWRFPYLPCLTDEPVARSVGSFGATEIPGFHPKGKQTKRWNPYGLLSRRFFGKLSAAKEVFPLTETAKSYNNRGGWAKSSTTIEVIEPFSFVSHSTGLLEMRQSFSPLTRQEKPKRKGHVVFLRF